MKKVLTVIISAIGFGLIAGLVFTAVTLVFTKTGIISNNAIVKSVENISKTKSIDTIEDEERRGTKLDGSIHILRPKKRKCC